MPFKRVFPKGLVAIHIVSMDSQKLFQKPSLARTRIVNAGTLSTNSFNDNVPPHLKKIAHVVSLTPVIS